MKYKLVIFDMDGTILDTLEDLMLSVNYIMDQYGYPTHTLLEVKSYVGNGIYKLIFRVPILSALSILISVFFVYMFLIRLLLKLCLCGNSII